MEQIGERRGPLVRLASQPLFWLLLAIAVSAAVLEATGRLEPHVRPDTQSYQQAARATTLEGALQQHRTMGYPLFLRAVRLFSQELAPLPRIHVALIFAATVLFWLALRAWTGSGWMALAAAMPLTAAPILAWVEQLLPDFVAAALFLSTVAWLLLLVLRPARWTLWVLLGLSVLLAYQFRPSYLFLVPLVPFVAWLLRLCREGAPRWAQVGWAAGLALVTMVPLLLFSGLRQRVVGDFGLVSFTGINLIGVTASLLDEEIVETLPAETRAVAIRILGQREEWRWSPMRLGDDTRIWQEQHNTNIWRISVRPARRLEERRAQAARRRGEERRFRDIEVNATLLALSKEVIRQRPRLYLQWVRDTFLSGVGKMARYPLVLWPMLALAISLPIAWRRRREAGVLNLRLLGFVLLCGVFTWVHLLLVVVVSNAYDRYLAGVALLLPSALCALLFGLWRGMLRAPEGDT